MKDAKFVVGLDDGLRIPALQLVSKVQAKDLNGSLSILDGQGLPPGGFISPHTHSREDECFFVMEGEFHYSIGDEMGAASSGSYILKPRGLPHAFCNKGTVPARALMIFTPGGAEAVFQGLADLSSKGMDRDAERKARAVFAAQYGVTFHDELIPEYRARFGLGQ